MLPLPGLRRHFGVLAVLGTLTAAAILVQADGLATLLTGGGVTWALVAAIAVRALLAGIQGSVGGRFAATVKAGLRKRLLGAEAENPGEVATLVTKGIDAGDAYLTGYLPAVVLSAIVPLAVLVRLFIADLSSALIITATLPLIPVFAILVGQLALAKTAKQWSLLSKLGGHFLDVVRGLGTLKVFGRAEAQAKTVRAMADAHTDATMRTLRVAFLSALVLELVATLSVALVAVPIGFRLLEGGMVVHTAVLVLLLAPEAYLPLRAAGAKFHASAEGLATLREALAVRSADVVRGSRVARRDAPRIVLEKVSVAYGEETVLSEVDMTIEPGEHVALVGPSGSGKSTLLAVLLGFVTPTSGRVLVDGVDLRELDPAAWRAGTAWVPQRPTLFTGTVEENIAMGQVPDVQAAARAAAFDEVVRGLPDGYRTRIGELGAPLSAGQRQRLGLARALARTEAGLALLDEPTARLDAGTEAAVLGATRELLTGRTAVLVAHRPAMAELATRVLEVHDGAVRERELV
ncbi:thiol reductant ABC exporter subunit CydD [Amycolatopsis decaplanina]|uniref:Fused ATPase and permease components of ABC transport system n=1 Tax=Amycolatopsis decaplanina DSM 44594 TaxID=1284240 RepID=M2ZAW5_9PSEU|nr:thiol reductant ABC exporter subunit CydD [Amycolatopsis decaplanina]EME57499.1 fused ATPase and permease components of ABC transport system [Amycolatopsis decaplanina DSM 44594]